MGRCCDTSSFVPTCAKGEAVLTLCDEILLHLVFHEAKLSVENHCIAILKAARVKNLGTYLSIHCCEEPGNSIAAVVSLGPLA